MRIWLRRLVYILTGLSFWIPGIFVHAVRRLQFGESRLDLLAIMTLPLFFSVVALELVFRLTRGMSSRGAIALWMLFGIWFFGSGCAMAGATFSGGGFAQPQEAWQIIRWSLMGLFVPMTLITSTYDGTIVPLIAITIGFILTAAVGWWIGQGNGQSKGD